MNKTHTRIAVTEGEFPYLIQISNDNLSWSTVDRKKLKSDAMERARTIEGYINEDWKHKIVHVLWRTK